MTSGTELFSRERLAGYDPVRLGNSVALVIGAGALGQNVIQDLALAGIGEIRIVDKDSFEHHNRTRSPAYPTALEQKMFGLGKAGAVARKLGGVMTAQKPVMRYANSWIEELGHGAFKNVSVVVSCVDKPSARAYISDQARLHGLPLVEGGFEGANVALSCFPSVSKDEARTAPCWRCSHQDFESVENTFSCAYYASRAEETGIIPAIQNAAAILGGLQSEAAILCLHSELDRPLELRCLTLNIRTGNVRLVKLATDPACPGVHRAFGDQPVPLRSRSEDTIEVLLNEIAQHIPDYPTIELQSPLIWTAPCTKCKHMVFVARPTWTWRSQPFCEACGGSFSSNSEGGSSPTIYSQLNSESHDRILNISCAQAGFGPAALIEASSATKSGLFELSGSIDQLFTSGDSDGQRQDSSHIYSSA